MHQLAFIEVVAVGGAERKIPIADIADVLENTGGAKVTMRSGQSFETSTTAASIFTAINAQWTAYLTALGNP